MTNRRELLGAIGAAIAVFTQAEENHAETVLRHPGFVLGYVIDGAFRFAIDGQPERVLHAGEAFYEPPGAQHTVSASADPRRSTRILAIIISERKT